MSSSPSAFYHSNIMNTYLANESLLIDSYPRYAIPDTLSDECNYLDQSSTSCSVKENIMIAIKNKEDDHNMIFSNNLFDFYSTQPIYYNEFMTGNSLSSCSPPPLLSPDCSNTGLYYNNPDTADDNSNYFYNTPIEYPLSKPESMTYAKATTDFYVDDHKRHSSPESTCSVSSVNKKIFSCNYCSRSFARKYDVARHKRIHTGVKPYVCPCCSKGFSRSDARVRHFRTESMCRDGANKLGKQRRGHKKTCH